MSICLKLALRNLRKDKGRTLITLLGIVLSVLMICTVLTLLNSMLNSTVDGIIDKDGNWHIAVYNATTEQTASWKEAADVSSTEEVSGGENRIFRITLKEPKEVYSFAEKHFDKDTQYAFHTELLSYLGVSQNDNIKGMIIGIASVILIIIGVGAVSLIYNAFAISVSGRTKEIGLLASLGATREDIRQTVYSEAFLLGTVAIPTGIGIGLLISTALLDIFGVYMRKLLYMDIAMKLYTSPWLIAFTVIFSYLLVFLSAGIPARNAARVSIIGNLKGDKGTLKVKNSNFASCAERLLASRNRKREKRSFRAITFSLGLSIFLFVSANAFSFYILSFVDAEMDKIGYDLRMNYSMVLGEDNFDKLYSFVCSEEGIDEVGWFSECPTNYGNVLLKSEWLDDKYRETNAEGYKGTEFYKAPFYLFVISDERYAEFLKDNKLNDSVMVYAKAFFTAYNEDGTTATYPIVKSGDYESDVMYMSEAATKRYGNDVDANSVGNFDYEDYFDSSFHVLMNVGDYDFPLEFRANEGGICIMIPESRLSEFSGTILSKEIMIRSPNYKAIQKNISDYLTSAGLADNVSVFNSAENYESQRNLAAVIKLFSTSFLILLTVIACANIINVVTTSLNMRKREFAVLRSVGMTMKGLFGMLCLENLRSGIVSVFIGGLASLPICFLLYKSIVIGAVIKFSFPVKAYVISSLAMLTIMLLTSVYGLWKVKRGNVITNIRHEFT